MNFHPIVWYNQKFPFWLRELIGFGLMLGSIVAIVGAIFQLELGGQ